MNVTTSNIICEFPITYFHPETGEEIKLEGYAGKVFQTKDLDTKGWFRVEKHGILLKEEPSGAGSNKRTGEWYPHLFSGRIVFFDTDEEAFLAVFREGRTTQVFDYSK